MLCTSLHFGRRTEKYRIKLRELIYKKENPKCHLTK